MVETGSNAGWTHKQFNVNHSLLGFFKNNQSQKMALPTCSLALQTGRLKLISYLIYAQFRQIHYEKLKQEKELTLNMPTA